MALLQQANANGLSEKILPAPWKKSRRNSRTCLLDLGPPTRVPVDEVDFDCSAAATFPVSEPAPRCRGRGGGEHALTDKGSSKTAITAQHALSRQPTSRAKTAESHTGTGTGHRELRNVVCKQAKVSSHREGSAAAAYKENIPRNNVHSEKPILHDPPCHSSRVPPTELPPRPHPRPRPSTPHPLPSSRAVTPPHCSASTASVLLAPSSPTNTTHPSSLSQPSSPHSPQKPLLDPLSPPPPPSHPPISLPSEPQTNSTHPPLPPLPTFQDPLSNLQPPPSLQQPLTADDFPSSLPHSIHPPSTKHPSSSSSSPPSPSLPFFSPPKPEDVVVMRDGKAEKRFRRIGMLGRGGSSKVFKVMSEACEMFALKEVYLKHLDSAVKMAYITEINFLRRLKNVPEVVTLHCFNWSKEEGILSLLLEYGETDLATVIKSLESSVSSSLPSALFYWSEMLRIMTVVHKEGIIHNDLKLENFVCIRGRLKLIDFGIANRIEDEHTSVQRDICCGTINYMSPETIDDEKSFKVGRASDVWSLGCILYRMVYGYTPFECYKKIQRLQAIINPAVSISFPDIGNPAAVDVMKKCLNRNPKKRPTVEQLLTHPFTLNRQQ